MDQGYQSTGETMTPQLLITLSPSGDLVAELPGHQATRRQLPLDVRTAGAVIRRILEAQAAGRSPDDIGHESAPTCAQVRDWEAVLKRMPEGLTGASVAKVTAEELGL